MRVKSQHTRLIVLFLVVLSAVPVSFAWVLGFAVWTSPLVFLASLRSLSLSLMSLLGLAELIVIFWRPRWYCKWCCPTGLLCDAVSQKSRRRLFKKLPPLGMFSAFVLIGSIAFGASVVLVFDPIVALAAFLNSVTQPGTIVWFSILVFSVIISINLLSRNVWCAKLCPLGGLQDAATKVSRWFQGRKTDKIRFDTHRRVVLGALGGLGAGLLLTRTQSDANVLRPPAALAEADFQLTCLRCGNCMQTCPTHILVPQLAGASLTSLFTPQVTFDTGYCLPDCTRCGDICPSGAIAKFSRQDKKHTKIGIARIDIKNCLLTKHQECDRCRFYCEFNAIEIQVSDEDFSSQPMVIREKCVGCGACEVVCPVGVITIHPFQLIKKGTI